eukprot:4126027-Prymnesium_polylepis.1
MASRRAAHGQPRPRGADGGREAAPPRVHRAVPQPHLDAQRPADATGGALPQRRGVLRRAALHGADVPQVQRDAALSGRAHHPAREDQEWRGRKEGQGRVPLVRRERIQSALPRQQVRHVDPLHQLGGGQALEAHQGRESLPRRRQPQAARVLPPPERAQRQGRRGVRLHVDHAQDGRRA